MWASNLFIQGNSESYIPCFSRFSLFGFFLCSLVLFLFVLFQLQSASSSPPSPVSLLLVWLRLPFWLLFYFCGSWKTNWFHVWNFLSACNGGILGVAAAAAVALLSFHCTTHKHTHTHARCSPLFDIMLARTHCEPFGFLFSLNLARNWCARSKQYNNNMAHTWSKATCCQKESATPTKTFLYSAPCFVSLCSSSSHVVGAYFAVESAAASPVIVLTLDYPPFPLPPSVVLLFLLPPTLLIPNVS